VRSLRNISAGIGVVVGVVTFVTPGLLFPLLTAAAAGTVLAAERRLGRLEKEKRSAPRRFTDLDRVALINVIGTDPKGRIHLTAIAADAEILQLANDLKQAFMGAGFHVSGPLVPPLPPNVRGVRVSIHVAERAGRWGQQITGALHAAGIAAELTKGPPSEYSLSVEIGPKP
jgi:hypothetical protein